MEAVCGAGEAALLRNCNKKREMTKLEPWKHDAPALATLGAGKLILRWRTLS